MFELLSIFLLYKIAATLAGHKLALDTAWLYTMNPVTWLTTVRYGQDESVILFFICLAVYCCMRGWRWLLPVILALGVMLTKPTTAAAMFAAYSYSRNKIRDAAIAVTIITVVLVPFIFARANIAMPFTWHKSAVQGLSITKIAHETVLNTVSSAQLSSAATVVTIIVTLGTLYLAHRRRLHVLDGVTVTLIAFLLFAPVSLRFYALWYFGPLTIYALRAGRVNRYILLSALFIFYDDWAFGPPSPTYVTYALIAVGIVIVGLVISFALDILRQEKAKLTDPSVQSVYD